MPLCTENRDIFATNQQDSSRILKRRQRVMRGTASIKEALEREGFEFTNGQAARDGVEAGVQPSWSRTPPPCHAFTLWCFQRRQAGHTMPVQNEQDNAITGQFLVITSSRLL